MFYRKVEAQAHSEPVIGGGGVPVMTEMQVDKRMFVRGSGQVSYAEEKVEPTRSFSEGTRKAKADDRISPEKIKAPLRGQWKGDVNLVAKMDAEREYGRLSSLIGAYLEPFEHLVCDNYTYEQVGREIGVGNRTGASAAAQMIAHIGLVAIRDNTNISREDLV